MVWNCHSNVIHLCIHLLGQARDAVLTKNTSFHSTKNNSQDANTTFLSFSRYFLDVLSSETKQGSERTATSVLDHISTKTASQSWLCLFITLLQAVSQITYTLLYTHIHTNTHSHAHTLIRLRKHTYSHTYYPLPRFFCKH